MKENGKTEKGRDEEVDFEPLVAWFLQFFRGITSFFNGIGRAFKAHFTLIIAYVVVGGLIGGGIYLFAPKMYSSNMALRSANSDNQTSYILLKGLGTLAEDKSHQTLAQELGIEEDIAKDIFSIKFLDFRGMEPNAEDTVVEKKNFSIEVELWSNENLDQIGQALVNYLETRPYTAELKERKRNVLTAQIEKMATVLGQYDSLKTKVERSIDPRGKGEGLIFGEPINPVEISKESDRIFEQLLYMKEELRTLKSFKVINNMVPNSKPTFPRLRVILYSIGIFLLIGMIAAYRKEQRLTSTNS